MQAAKRFVRVSGQEYVNALATVNSFTVSNTSVASASCSNDNENVSKVRHRKAIGHCPLMVCGRRLT